MVDLEILVSRKGTKVVTATNLYAVLQLPKSRYNHHVRKWLNDVYEFKDGIRLPVSMRDFAKRNSEVSIVDDYYLTVELAKLITLNSESKFKRKYSNRLLSLEDKVENAELLTKDQVIAVLELAKVMGLTSCQVASERGHHEWYEEINGSAADWWQHRSRVLGYSASDLRSELPGADQKNRNKSQRELLFKVDKYETIRAGIIDLFMALGKNETYARNMGDLAKVFAKELGIDIWDDRKQPVAFSSAMNEKLVHEIKGMEKRELLNLL